MSPKNINYFRKIIFSTSFSLAKPGFLKLYSDVKKNEKLSYNELKQNQEKQLKKIINFAYSNVPYYNNLFKTNKIEPEEIKTLGDLEKIPILTKDEINENWNQFIPRNLQNQKYINFSTGGTTGTPMRYRISRYERFLAAALRFQWWSWAGYKLGDKVAIMGGSSLIPKKTSITSKMQLYVQNFLSFSSFDLEDENLKKYLAILNKKKPKFLYGYASSIYFFSDWLERNDLEVYSPQAIFTTSEKLYDNMRKKIETIFNVKILDGYGLNDGGLHAAECSENNGYHIDTIRSIFHVIDNNGTILDKGDGKAIATSLYNYAMPFINYDTSDLVKLKEDFCSCGRETKMLESITGRTVDILFTPEKKTIHGWFILYLFWEYGDKIKRYQVIQEDLKNLVIYVVPEKDEYLDEIENNLKIIKQIIWERSPNWNIKIKFVKEINQLKSGKYQFIINNISNK